VELWCLRRIRTAGASVVRRVGLKANWNASICPSTWHFYTGPDERIRAQALRAGAICYLTKPFHGDSLIQGLQAALQKKHDGGARK